MKKILKINLICILMLFCIIASGTVYAATVTTGGINLSNAKSFNIGDTIKETLPASGSHYFKFSVPTNAIIIMDAQTGNSKQGLFVTLRNSTGAKIKCFSTEDEYNWGYQFFKEYYSLTAGTYYFEMECLDHEFGVNSITWSMKTSYHSTSTSANKIGGQANNNLSSAVPITLGNQISGVTEYIFKNDVWQPCHYYKLTLSSRKKLSFTSSVQNLENVSYDEFPKIDIRNSQGKRVEIFEDITNCQYTLDAGTYYIGITDRDQNADLYKITINEITEVQKKENTLTVKPKTATVKASKLKKKKQTIKPSKAFVISNAQGAVTFTKVGGSKKLTISQNGTITVKKKTKKGTYKINVLVTASGNNQYYVGNRVVTVKVKVKK